MLNCPGIWTIATCRMSWRGRIFSSALAGMAPSFMPRGTPMLTTSLFWGSIWAVSALWQNWSQLSKRKYTIEPRMMLDVSVRRGRETLYRDLALNDAVITKGAVARVIDLIVRGDGVHIYDYSGDGVILATPTGSTAYSMSAGGPIVEPTSENILVTPICAHSLHAKPLVMGRDRIVSVRIGKLSRKTAYLSVDGGRAFKLCGGDTVEVRRSKSVTRLVRLTDHSFYEIINQKLGRA